MSSEQMADQFVDEVAPEELDWRELVRRYPVASLAVAALGGFVLGRSRGRAIVAALGAYAGDLVAREVNELLGEDVI